MKNSEQSLVAAPLVQGKQRIMGNIQSISCVCLLLQRALLWKLHGVALKQCGAAGKRWSASNSLTVSFRESLNITTLISPAASTATRWGTPWTTQVNNTQINLKGSVHPHLRETQGSFTQLSSVLHIEWKWRKLNLLKDLNFFLNYPNKPFSDAGELILWNCL